MTADGRFGLLINLPLSEAPATCGGFLCPQRNRASQVVLCFERAPFFFLACDECVDIVWGKQDSNAGRVFPLERPVGAVWSASGMHTLDRRARAHTDQGDGQFCGSAGGEVKSVRRVCERMLELKTHERRDRNQQQYFRIHYTPSLCPRNAWMSLYTAHDCASVRRATET